MRNVAEKYSREDRSTHFVLNKFFLKKSAFCEIMRKNIAQPDRPQTTISGMRTACWITTASSTQTVQAILTALPPQKWLQERASILRYT